MADSTPILDAPTIDTHTHTYLPRYAQAMRDRAATRDLPYVLPAQGGDVGNGEEALFILPGEDEEGGGGGRPIDASYTTVEGKLAYMDKSGIDISVVSTANPWLDWVAAGDQADMARQLNADLDAVCEKSGGRLYGFGMLPLDAGAGACLAELDNLAASRHCRGVIMGTSGLGKGLDDPALQDVWRKVQDLGQTVFLHPHFGVGTNDDFGGYGHTLHLALGFPFETTTAVSRLVLSGQFERTPTMNLLLAHSGGCTPFLAGRLDACARVDPHVKQLPHAPSYYLSNLLYDAITYEPKALELSLKFASPDQLMFGTDHPFSIADPAKVKAAIHQAAYSIGADPVELEHKVRHGNAERILNIKAEQLARKV